MRTLCLLLLAVIATPIVAEDLNPLTGEGLSAALTNAHVVYENGHRQSFYDDGSTESRPGWAAVFLPSAITEAGYLHNLRNDSICSVARVVLARCGADVDEGVDEALAVVATFGVVVCLVLAEELGGALVEGVADDGSAFGVHEH